MPLKIKADEDLPGSVAVRLREAGYLAETVVEEGMGGTNDPALWRVVQAEGRFLITADKGFADVRKYPPGTHQGVLLLRPNEDGIGPLDALVEMVLREGGAGAATGSGGCGNPARLAHPKVLT
jgi:predicted nuclease of predicted toxin-antitoxin system